MTLAKTDRNQKLYTDKQEGMSIRDLMMKYKLSYARVNQILKTHEGQTTREQLKEKL